jgi:hypothetical protein
MLAGAVDHLWQSICCFAIVCGLVLVVRRHAAALQAWLWRIAALKFLLPFGLLFALGGWLGLPVRHSAVPPPATLSAAVSAGLSIAAPAATWELPTWWALVSLALLLGATGGCSLAIVRGLQLARRARDAEAVRQAADWHYHPSLPGFWQSTLLAAVALLAVSLPMIAGATRNREWRQAVLAFDQEALRSAGIVISEAPPGAGARSHIDARDDGVEIHNINLQDLVSLVYGIGKFEVFGGAMPWLEYPRYEVRVIGPVHAPEVFDPYSLREPMTHHLYQQFGVSIRVNGNCEKPCKDYESIQIERLPRCTRLLSAHPGCS